MSYLASAFGVVADGVTDNTANINSAIAQVSAKGGGVLEFPSGVYAVSTGIRLAPAVMLVGDSPYSTRFLLTSAALSADMVFAYQANGAEIHNVTFDQNNKVTPAALGCSILSLNTNTDLWVENCHFVNWDKFAIGLAASQRNMIKRCVFIRNTTVNADGDAVNSSGPNTMLSVIENTLVNCATDLCMTGDIIGNVITGFGFGAGITLEQGSDCHSVNILHNRVSGGVGLDVNKTVPHGIECWAATARIMHNECFGNAGDGIDVCGPNSVVEGNLCYDNGGTLSPQCAGIVAIYGNSTYNCSGSMFAGNRCFDTRGAKGTQKYGWIVQKVNGVAPTGLKSAGNHYDGNAIAPMLTNGVPYSAGV